jgi:hypothetical protein
MRPRQSTGGLGVGGGYGELVTRPRLHLPSAASTAYARRQWQRRAALWTIFASVTFWVITMLVLLLLPSALPEAPRGEDAAAVAAAAARLVRHMRARELLLRRNATRLVFLVPTQARACHARRWRECAAYARARARDALLRTASDMSRTVCFVLGPCRALRRTQAARDAVCALAAAAGEMLAPWACGGSGRGGEAGEEEEALSGGAPAAQCRALRSSPHSTLLLSALPDLPYRDARASYVALLDDTGGAGAEADWGGGAHGRALARRAARMLLRPWRPRDSGLAAEAPALRALGGAAARAARREELSEAHLRVAQARPARAQRATAGAAHARYAPSHTVCGFCLPSALSARCAQDALASFDAVLTLRGLREGVTSLETLTGWRLPADAAAAAHANANADASTAAAASGRAPPPPPPLSRHPLEAALLTHAAALATARQAQPQPQQRAPRPVVPSCSDLTGASLSLSLSLSSSAHACADCLLLCPSGAPLSPGPVPPGAGADAAGGSCDAFAHDTANANASSRPPPPFVALCAAVRDGGAFLEEWLTFHAAAGATRVYLHDDGSRDDTGAILSAWASAAPSSPYRAFVTPLAATHGPPRHGVAQRTPAGGWSGQREILGRCLTHAIMDGACWLINVDLDEYVLPRGKSMRSIGEALEAHATPGRVCATVRRHGARELRFCVFLRVFAFLRCAYVCVR